MLFRSAGKYKSFVEPFTANAPSPESQEADKFLLSDAWDGYTADVEKARGLPEGALSQWIQQRPVHIALAGGDPGCPLIDVPAGTRICAQGSAPTAFFLLIEGQVGLSNTAPNGSSVVVEVLHPGAHFMMSSVLARLPMLMNADATAASRVIAVDGEALYALIETDAAIATAVLRAEALDFRAMVRTVTSGRRSPGLIMGAPGGIGRVRPA